MIYSTSYFKAIEFLESFLNFPFFISKRKLKSKEYLKKIRNFLNLIKIPYNKMNFIHITGTAGKGSLATMLHSILRENNLKVGLFTSPYLISPIEKIRINEKFISPLEFSLLIEKLKPYLDNYFLKKEQILSYFDIFFILALIYFYQKKCDWVILETGIGANYDPTNIISSPKICVITNIGLDHTKLLGNSLKEIAKDKAAIIKKGCVFFTLEKRPSLLNIFKKKSSKEKALFFSLKEKITSISYLEKGMQFKLQNDKSLWQIKFRGSSQVKNAILAINIARYLKVPEEKIRKGLKKAYLPGRFEIVQKKPYVVLDGSHNLLKIKSVIDNLNHLRFRKLFLIFALALDKDLKKILREIIPLTDKLYATRFLIKEKKCTPPFKIINEAKKIKSSLKTKLHLDPEEALKEALKEAHKSDLILVLGSFFLVGHLRKKWYSLKKILLKRYNL